MAIHTTASGTNRWFIDNPLLDDMFDGGGTIMAWCFHDVEPSGAVQYIAAMGETVFRFQQHSGGNNRLFFGLDFDTTAGIWFTPFPADVPQGVWNHLAVVYNADAVGNDPVFLINGVDGGIDEAVAPVGTRVANTETMNALGSGSTPGRHFQEDLRFYDRALSVEEILTIVAVRGPDGIVDGLLARHLQDENHQGVVVPTTAGFIKDVGPSGAHGKNAATNPTYEAGNIRTRRKVA